MALEVRLTCWVQTLRLKILKLPHLTTGTPQSYSARNASVFGTLPQLQVAFRPVKRTAPEASVALQFGTLMGCTEALDVGTNLKPGAIQAHVLKLGPQVDFLRLKISTRERSSKANITPPSVTCVYCRACTLAFSHLSGQDITALLVEHSHFQVLPSFSEAYRCPLVRHGLSGAPAIFAKTSDGSAAA